MLLVDLAACELWAAIRYQKYKSTSTMTRHIRPLVAEDLGELSGFLSRGFGAPVDADFADAEVLRWKYLEPVEASAEDLNALSLVATDETGRIIGHLGVCRTSFQGQGIGSSGPGIPTIHIIDWLGSPEHRSVGMSLMRRAHQSVPTQFGLGVSPSALVVGERSGYQLRALVPAFSRVLRPGYWKRTGSLGFTQRMARFTRDAGLHLWHGATLPRPDGSLRLERTPRFGQEIVPVIEKAYAHAVFTQRDPARLNHVLDFPRQAMTGWHLVDRSGVIRGFAILNVIPKDLGRTRVGKVVDCVLDHNDPKLWNRAQIALTDELKRQGADIAQAYGSTPWAAASLESAGYAARFDVKFHIRDRQSLIPASSTFHLTPLEGDYGYT
jgi:hypothetical protein